MMTVSRLHKMLGALIEAGHGRKPVLVDRQTFRDPRDNDGELMLPPWAVQGPRWIPTADDDGGTKWNKDGSESGQQCVLIVGDCAEPESSSGADGVAACPPGHCRTPSAPCRGACIQTIQPRDTADVPRPTAGVSETSDEAQQARNGGTNVR